MLGRKIFLGRVGMGNTFCGGKAYSPGAGARAGADGGCFNMMLRGGQNKSGARIILGESVEELRRGQRGDFITVQHLVDWGLGVYHNSALRRDPTAIIDWAIRIAGYGSAIPRSALLAAGLAIRSMGWLWR